jgi:hypothetical protein
MYDLSEYTVAELIALRSDQLAQAASFRTMASYASKPKIRKLDIAQAESNENLAALCEAELTRRGEG